MIKSSIVRIHSFNYNYSLQFLLSRVDDLCYFCLAWNDFVGNSFHYLVELESLSTDHLILFQHVQYSQYVVVLSVSEKQWRSHCQILYFYRVFFLHIFKINVVEVKDRLEHRPRISSENMYCLSTDQACKFGHRKINYV